MASASNRTPPPPPPPPAPPGTHEQHSASPTALEHQSTKTRLCRYFTKTGSCRTGTECHYRHDDTRLPRTSTSAVEWLASQAEMSDSASEDGTAQDRRQAATQPLPSRVVEKPIPQSQARDPREFQLGQIRRRFPLRETRHGQLGTWATLLKFSLTPSDPDFPFEMTALECLLSVPATYPRERPSLKIGNNDIPRGFAVNVELGFEGLVADKPNATLLELTKALDKNLEAFLSAPKADLVKLVPNKDTRHLAAVPSPSVEPTISHSKPIEPSSSNASSRAVKPIVDFTEKEKASALKARASETRQLEARMGRLPLYKKSDDGIAYTLPIEPRRRGELKVDLQAVKTIALFVPRLYPLEACRIRLDGVDAEEAMPVETGFFRRANEQKDISLLSHVNYLAQNMHVLAKTILPPAPAMCQPVVETESVEPPAKGHRDADRSHIQYITRPPEWVDPEDVHSDSDGLYSYDTEDGTSDEDEDEDGGVGLKLKHEDGETSKQSAHKAERGTAISLPFIELYGIELLEVVNLNITVKCERCREITEFKGLKSGITKDDSCRKCATRLAVTYRQDIVHANAVRVGFLDLEGCIIGDMLPSSFIPTCSQCSTPYPAPGIVSVQGDTVSNVCRECHQKFTFKIPQVKFLRITSADHLPPASGPRRKKETLGLVAGTELPKRGRCRHYSKSYRWFRFSCCQKVYSCDRCHDEEEEHPNEWANRMICGWCSREQNYRPEECGVCHASLVGKKGGGFWEGGKGTRDKVRMSKKDKRKYRRIGSKPATTK